MKVSLMLCPLSQPAYRYLFLVGLASILAGQQAPIFANSECPFAVELAGVEFNGGFDLANNMH